MSDAPFALHQVAVLPDTLAHPQLLHLIRRSVLTGFVDLLKQPAILVFADEVLERKHEQAAARHIQIARQFFSLATLRRSAALRVEARHIQIARQFFSLGKKRFL
jgi:hypothetical protein